MLKNPKKADLNKDGKLSSYEKRRGMAIEKAMAKQDKGTPMEDKRANFMGGGIAYKGGGMAMKRNMYGEGTKPKLGKRPIEIGKRPGDKVRVEAKTMSGRKFYKLVPKGLAKPIKPIEPKGTIRRREIKNGK